MTTFAPDDLNHVLKAFSPALKSIDIRTVAVCSSSEEPWQNLVTSIILSDKTVEEIKAEHEKLPPVRNPNNQFAIFLGAFPFDYSIFDKISNGEIRFPALTFGINRIKTREVDPLALKVNSTQEWINGSLCYILRAVEQGVLEERAKFWTIVNEQDRFSKRFGFSNVQQLIKDYLKMNDYGNGNRKDFEIVIPQLAQIQNLQFLENQFIVDIQKPTELVGLQLNIQLKRDFQTLWRNVCEIEGTNNSIEFNIDGLLPFDLMSVDLIHRDSGLTIDRTDKKVPLENVAEPFVKTLDAFCSLDKLQKMLFEPENYGKNPAKIFENAVTWLLSLAGFETLHVGIIIKKLNGKEEKFDSLQSKSGKHIGSADIIAYEENERLLLIDCDIDFVDPKKVKKMADMKKHFRKQLKGYEKLHIVPILFTPIDFRKESPSIDVMIADQAIIKRIFEAVTQGNREQARALLYYSGL